MATFTAQHSWREGGPQGKSYLVRRGTLSVASGESVGATAGDIPASVFGMIELLEASHILEDDNSTLFLGVPDKDGASLLVHGFAGDTTGTHVPATFVDLTDNKDYILTVKGRG